MWSVGVVVQTFESCPLNAWFLEVVLMTALVGTRSLNSNMNDTERKLLVDE